MKKKYYSPSFVILKDNCDFCSHFGYRQGIILFNCLNSLTINDYLALNS